ncbi:two-component sensor histidine kinase [Rudanella paleaurantiibacter]|uniref:histidine kinase n=1 Tax=Rudanella paleaurantiibacter TaxID=2614655 RepID=A0A7J5U256_9BACT|nr:ATP-binding protein [Rudanella paleaurantiibacter]KAB7731857.1 two-component sensor histidine kinase [Rudanella paleaurantiibacter]
MSLSPRIIAFLLAVLISGLTVAFLSVVDGVTINMLFVVAVSSFIVSFFLILYAVELLVYREVNKMYKTIRRLKLRDFNLSNKTIIKNNNPFKKLNDEIFVYVAKKQKEIDELKRLEQFRREFLADVSHELKTPIFAAQGFIHTLIDGAVDDEFVRDKFLAKAARSLDGLDALVKDLVALSQLETGEIRMHLERVDIYQITLEIFEQLENIAEAKGITLRIKSSLQRSDVIRADVARLGAARPDAARTDLQGPVWVMADPQRITQVMTNLIENGIKYGNDAGKVVVSFADDKKHISISVRDDGPGIAPEHLSRIFERFYRVEKSRSKERGGTGLGLAIVKHILNAHKSKITVMSKPDKGTMFRFKLEKAVETEL